MYLYSCVLYGMFVVTSSDEEMRNKELKTVLVNVLWMVDLLDTFVVTSVVTSEYHRVPGFVVSKVGKTLAACHQ